jgi:dolichol-phosphate mannosyltransferase
MTSQRKISICIPVFNEAKNLPVAIKTVEDLFFLPESPLRKFALELVVTDNASTDETWAVVKKLSEEKSHLKAYRFSRNFGYQNSVFTGIFMATGDAVVELDADLEDPPAVILEFVRRWEEGYEVAYGVRGKRHAPWIMRVFFRLFYKILSSVSDLEIPENSGDFRLLDRKVVDVLKLLPERNLYLRGLVSYLGFKQIAVPYNRDPRLSGTSKFRFFHYVVLAIDAITAFSKTPLRLIGALGVGVFIFSVFLSVWYLVGYLLHGAAVPGFTTLVVLLLMLHSVTFIFLGILGEYLSRIFDDSKSRPRVIIAEALNDLTPPKVL